MKNILIITLGILALSLLAIPANAQTLKADNVQFISIIFSEYGNNLAPLAGGHSVTVSDIFSVTLPSTKDPKYTVVFNDGTTVVTTATVLVVYRPKPKGSATDTEQE